MTFRTTSTPLQTFHLTSHERYSLTAGKYQEESSSSAAESEDEEPRPVLKVIYHRREGEEGEEREERRRERSRSRDDEDVQQTREEVGNPNDPGRPSSSRGEAVGIGSEERTRRNLATADLDSAIPPDDMIHVPGEWIEGMEESIERLRYGAATRGESSKESGRSPEEWRSPSGFAEIGCTGEKSGRRRIKSHITNYRIMKMKLGGGFNPIKKHMSRWESFLNRGEKTPVKS